jgi:RND family efflux transporter MFP subunit
MTVEQPPEPAQAPAPTQTQTHSHIPAAKPGRPAWGVLVVILIVGAAALAYAIFTGITARVKASESLNQSTRANAIPTVIAVHPKASAGVEEIAVPGNMQAFIDTPIWARASGYLKHWNVDIGGRVKQGELLAEIESPEVDRQLEQARADLGTAQANLKLSEVTAERYTDLFKTDSVSKQDVDNAVQDQAAKRTAETSAQANVSRLEQLVSYEKVYAPFEGTITIRNIDVGGLVDAGANTVGKELFHLASTSTLRVYVNVPENYSQAAKPGVTSMLTLGEFPGRQFHGVVVRTAKAIDVASRTLLVEVDVKNPTGELLPGSFASVHLKLPNRVSAVTVPSNTLIFRKEGLQVAVVRNGHALLVPVVLGRDFGDDVEIVSGLSSADQAIVNPSDSLGQGEQVQIAAPRTGPQAD